MAGSKIPESLIQEQKNDDCHDNEDEDFDGEDEDYDDEEDKDETTVSKSCEKMWEIKSGAPGTCYYPRSNILIHEEEINVSLKRLIFRIAISTLTKTRIKMITFS